MSFSVAKHCRPICGIVCSLALAAGLFCSTTVADDTEGRSLERTFTNSVRPLLQTYCYSCHGNEKQEGKLNLSAFDTMEQVAGAHATWEAVLERLKASEMPPEEAKRQLTADQRQAIVAWISEFRALEAKRSAGDPGIVPVRRLNNAEYNYTIRDLTGVDIRPAREFPVDPANEAGFDNSAQSLSMSPAMAKKYIEAARHVVEHLVLKPKGFAFAPHPVMTDTDRDKYCVRRIVDFYYRQPTDYAAYFLAAWKFKHRATLGLGEATLQDIAVAERVSPKYLTTIWSALEEYEFAVGPMAKLQKTWRELPSPEVTGTGAPAQRVDVPSSQCEVMRDWVQQLRRKLEPIVSNLKSPSVHDGSQPLVLWKNRQYAANRRTFSRDALQVEGTEENGDLDLMVPADDAERAPYEASFARFSSVFPDAFYVSERGRDYVGKPREQQEKGRLLSAGFHSQTGYFRDDGPLIEMVLSEAEKAELDGLWDEFEFVASIALRQYQGFLWFDRTDSRFMRDPEFDFARAEDRDAASEEKILRLADVYAAKARANGGGDVALAAIADYFREMNRRMRWVEQARLTAEPSHLASLVDFAQRAYRRPITQTERDDLLAFYHSLREKEQVTHEEAMQDAVMYVLMSPHFCYRMDLAAMQSRDQWSRSGEPATRSLNDYELANRLSYFLWSSMPDAELLAHAATGDLHERDVLSRQTRRMMQDDRINGLALEFGGNWLDFRRFDQHNSVDRGRFPTFSNELRQAMFEEPIRFFVDLIQNDRSVLDFLYARHTFVNGRLAEHYDLPDQLLGENEWVRIDDAAQYGRGGLLPMSVFLTQNSPGLRTSPVKRGYWVVRRLLGERIPAPPPNVPELPADETKLDLTLRETLAKHRDHVACAGCHERFDSFGLVFEGYGPIGEIRSKDLAGRPVETKAEFPGGGDGTGVEGLRSYLKQHREADFLDNLCRKLLSYGLGRTLLPSDDSLLNEMRQNLTAADHRFSSLVETIVASPQFLTKRSHTGRASGRP